MWWRYGRYEVGDGVIRPARRARLRRYDPGALHRQAAGERVSIPAYASLANALGRSGPPGTMTQEGELDPHAQQPVLDWCSHHGLLGLVPHMWEEVILPLGKKRVAGRYRKFRLRMIRRGGVWRAREERLPLDEGGGDPLGQWSEAQVRWSEIYGDQVRVDPLGDEWMSYFPDAPKAGVRKQVKYNYPEPLSERFWAEYGEPIDEFWSTAKHFSEAVVGLEAHRHRPSAGRLPIPEAEARSRLSKLTNPIGAVLEKKGRSGYERRWQAPSLLSALAMQVIEDLLDGYRIHSCERCGNLFRCTDRQARYCSDRCRWATQRKRHRAKQRARENVGPPR